MVKSINLNSVEGGNNISDSFPPVELLNGVNLSLIKGSGTLFGTRIRNNISLPPAKFLAVFFNN